MDINHIHSYDSVIQEMTGKQLENNNFYNIKKSVLHLGMWAFGHFMALFLFSCHNGSRVLLLAFPGLGTGVLSSLQDSALTMKVILPRMPMAFSPGEKHWKVLQAADAFGTPLMFGNYFSGPQLPSSVD